MQIKLVKSQTANIFEWQDKDGEIITDPEKIQQRQADYNQDVRMGRFEPSQGENRKSAIQNAQ